LSVKRAPITRVRTSAKEEVVFFSIFGFFGIGFRSGGFEAFLVKALVGFDVLLL